MAHLIWAPQAADDLEAICEYISRGSEGAAGRFAAGVPRATDLLEELPAAGRIVPEFADPALRELLHGNYRIIYEVSGDAVHLLSIHRCQAQESQSDVPGSGTR